MNKIKPTGFVPPKKSLFEKLADFIVRLKPVKWMTDEEKRKLLKKH